MFYSEPLNYKYCFLNGRRVDGTTYSSGTLDTTLEETHHLMNDEVPDDAALKDLPVITASESEMSNNDQVVSMEVLETNNAVT